MTWDAWAWLVLPVVLGVVTGVRALWPTPHDDLPYADDLEQLRRAERRRAAMRRAADPAWYREDEAVRW